MNPTQPLEGGLSREPGLSGMQTRIAGTCDEVHRFGSQILHASLYESVVRHAGDGLMLIFIHSFTGKVSPVAGG
jgi:hypothetical protein